MDDDRGGLGGEIAARPLHFIWLLDVSGSMAADGKMQALNVAVREAIPHLSQAAQTNPGAQLLVRALTFGTSVSWVVPQPLAIEDFRWVDLHHEERGLTEMGLAIRELTGQMKVLAKESRGYAPVAVLVSDGQPTNTKDPSLRAAMEELLAEPWGAKAIRRAVGIGRDADLDALKQFIGHPEIDPYRADNPEELAAALKFVSTVAVQAAAAPGQDAVASTLPPPEPVDTGPVW